MLHGSFCGKKIPEALSVVPIQMSILSQILEFIPILHIHLLPGRFCIGVLPSKPSLSNCNLSLVRGPFIQLLHIYFVGSPNLSFCFFR
jgi:hypothetical protein